MTKPLASLKVYFASEVLPSEAVRLFPDGSIDFVVRSWNLPVGIDCNRADSLWIGAEVDIQDRIDVALGLKWKMV